MKQVFRFFTILWFTIMIISFGIKFLEPIILTQDIVPDRYKSSIFNFIYYSKDYLEILISLSIFLIILKIFVSNSTTNKILKKSAATLGKIISIRETGAIVRRKPQIEYTIEFLLPNGVKIRYINKKVVKMVDLHQIKKEMVFIVKYDQNDPQKIAIDWNSSYDNLKKIQKKIQYYPGFVEMKFKIL